jgi:hypothetical protein
LKYITLVILGLISSYARADIITTSCQFAVEYNEVTYQHPEGCADKLSKLIRKETSEHSMLKHRVSYDKTWVSKNFDLTDPPNCPSEAREVSTLQGRVVSQIYINYKNDRDNALYESLRHCQIKPM